MSRLIKAAGALLLAASAAASSQPAPPPGGAPGARPESPDAAIGRDEARANASELATALEESYVFPEVAARYSAMLKANVAAGAYDGFTSAKAFAEKLTADLRAISPDNHLRVSLRPPSDAGRAAGREAPPPRRTFPFKAIEEARRIGPGIAYIRFNVFPGDEETVAAVRAFMASNADAKTIIFDNRTHHGGGLAEMDAMFPYLFAKTTTLVTMDTRASVDRERGSPIGDAMLRTVPAGAEVVRREHYVQPSATEKRLFGAKVFVLTSGATASAAEHMTLALKRTHRATIVGEPTAGAGHYGGMQTIGDKFGVFIPVGRTFDPDTNDDWEGDGIVPDVAVPAETALTEALVRSGLARPEAERISAQVKPTGTMARRNPRRV
jgi:Peptidase family S41/N-terminal domain of Peptidase_S41 in eukaryotic IRBP